MAENALTENQARLRRFLEEEAEAMLQMLRFYVLRAGLAQDRSATLAALELMNGVVVEALAHADRFQPERQPRAWLLGIAANLIRRQQASLARLQRREPLVGDLDSSAARQLSEEELFDRLASYADQNPEQLLQQEQELQRRLGGLSPGDQRVVRLAVLAGMHGQELAQSLGVSPGAARVRLHRALDRLRKSWIEQEGAGRDG